MHTRGGSSREQQSSRQAAAEGPAHRRAGSSSTAEGGSGEYFAFLSTPMAMVDGAISLVQQGH